ncbi:Uncharacterised protein [Bordetella pertussis]|nr:Uncharacterised protein [Bordetella pertussis]
MRCTAASWAWAWTAPARHSARAARRARSGKRREICMRELLKKRPGNAGHRILHAATPRCSSPCSELLR